MNTQRPFHLTALALALALAIAGCAAPARPGTPPMAATVNRDCAPWDGAAFTVSIPWADGGAVMVSIWSSPDIAQPSRFTFPDASGRMGIANYRNPAGTFEELSGRVSLESVNVGTPVEGELRLRSESGGVFEGSFRAQWGTLQVFCG